MTSFLIPERAESARLILRMFREEDWQAMHAHYADPDSTRYTLGRTLSEGESWRLTATLAGHWLLRGYGPYALEAKADGRVLGTVGLWHPVVTEAISDQSFFLGVDLVESNPAKQEKMTGKYCRRNKNALPGWQGIEMHMEKPDQAEVSMTGFSGRPR